VKSAKEGAIYNPPKICLLAARKGEKCPSIWPPCWPANGYFYDCCASGRPGQSHRSTAWSTDPHPWVRGFQSVDRAVDRPNWLDMCTSSCILVDRDGRL